jgi:hypothetical protein
MTCSGNERLRVVQEGSLEQLGRPRPKLDRTRRLVPSRGSSHARATPGLPRVRPAGIGVKVSSAQHAPERPALSLTSIRCRVSKPVREAWKRARFWFAPGSLVYKVTFAWFQLV